MSCTCTRCGLTNLLTILSSVTGFADMERGKPAHGTIDRYWQDCTCPDCRGAANRWWRERIRQGAQMTVDDGRGLTRPRCSTGSPSSGPAG